jgi:hypothetical protein
LQVKLLGICIYIYIIYNCSPFWIGLPRLPTLPGVVSLLDEIVNLQARFRLLRLQASASVELIYVDSALFSRDNAPFINARHTARLNLCLCLAFTRCTCPLLDSFTKEGRLRLALQYVGNKLLIFPSVLFLFLLPVTILMPIHPFQSILLSLLGDHL